MGWKFSYSFTPLRIIAASMVIVGHAYDLQGQSDIAMQVTGRSFGTLGVYIFFLLSGYLIFSSANRKPELYRFAKARALRILPGLWTMLFAVTISLAVVYDFSLFDGIKYIICNGSVFLNCYYLPGVFVHNINSAVNGSLWTLKFEAACYIGVGLLILFRLTENALILPLLAAAYLIFFFVPAPHPQLISMHQLGGCFLLGMILSRLFPLGPPPKAEILPDISYGIYIYAFPIQQALISHFGIMHPIVHALLALALTAIPATLSWFIIEKPLLRFKRTSRLRKLSSDRAASVL